MILKASNYISKDTPNDICTVIERIIDDIPAPNEISRQEYQERVSKGEMLGYIKTFLEELLILTKEKE